MPRPNRICIPHHPHHVVQRGNNRQRTFRSWRDHCLYLELLEDVAFEFHIEVHAYVLMPNHVHLLLTPAEKDGLSLTMQSIGRSYVRYFNSAHGRTGTLWEGRFKASVVDSSRYCLACYRYIELNPVRAGLCRAPADYRWSSYRGNALGRPDSLLSEHEEFRRLGDDIEDRRIRYRNLVRQGLDDSVLEQFRYGSRKGLPVGTRSFVSRLEEKLQTKLGDGQVGRPRKGI